MRLFVVSEWIWKAFSLQDCPPSHLKNFGNLGTKNVILRTKNAFFFCTPTPSSVRTHINVWLKVVASINILWKYLTILMFGPFLFDWIQKHFNVTAFQLSIPSFCCNTFDIRFFKIFELGCATVSPKSANSIFFCSMEKSSGKICQIFRENDFTFSCLFWFWMKRRGIKYDSIRISIFFLKNPF